MTSTHLQMAHGKRLFILCISVASVEPLAVTVPLHESLPSLPPTSPSWICACCVLYQVDASSPWLPGSIQRSLHNLVIPSCEPSWTSVPSQNGTHQRCTEPVLVSALDPTALYCQSLFTCLSPPLEAELLESLCIPGDQHRAWHRAGIQ